MNRLSRFVTTVAASGSLALAGLGLSAGTAQADPNTATVMTWCPGQAPPDRGIRWDMNVCHNYFITSLGTGNVAMVDYRGNPTESWFSADVPPPVLTPPPPHLRRRRPVSRSALHEEACSSSVRFATRSGSSGAIWAQPLTCGGRSTSAWRGAIRRCACASSQWSDRPGGRIVACLLRVTPAPGAAVTRR